MLVGIYQSGFPQNQVIRNEIYKRILKYNNIDFIELHIDDKDFWEKVKTIDLFLFRWTHVDNDHQLVSTILPVIENYLDIKCFPDLNTCWHYDDKVKQYYLLKTLGFPYVESYIFWQKEHAIEWAKNADYPVVFKLKKGAGSSNVILINNRNEAEKIILRMFGKGISSTAIKHKGKIKYKSIENLIRSKIDKYFLNKIRDIEPRTWQISKNYVLFQKFLPGNKYDTRVTTIGNKAFASRRFVREDDFRASGSGKSDFNKDNIDLRFVKLAFEISRTFKFQTMAYDFLFDENNQPQICEISYTYVDKSIYLCHGYWAVNTDWYEGNFSPQFLHLKDALCIEDLKQPEIKDIQS